ncbi:enoyl-CoA hydratase/carnithine racemase [Gloeopeniophorella convolvens]|nr:enoyl-CoA hydratase/carnithine racemase [Gloeopeniophorella convolvens]
MADKSASNPTPPAHTDEVKVSFPEEHVLLLTMNRPKHLNAMWHTMEDGLGLLLNWFEEEPSLWVAIITGEGQVFCAGADLRAWGAQQGSVDQQARYASTFNGFGSLSRRSSSKPIIAAVNGGAFGGAVEMIFNCDLVIASENAVFALPEVKRGVIAAQGVIPRIKAAVGHQLASEMLLLGRTVSAAEAYQRFGFVNLVVPREQLLPTAVQWARQITQNSPDAVQSTKRGLVEAAKHGNVEQATLAHVWSPESRRSYRGENMIEGLKAFQEKRKPVWRNPAKL